MICSSDGDECVSMGKEAAKGDANIRGLDV